MAAELRRIKDILLVDCAAGKSRPRTRDHPHFGWLTKNAWDSHEFRWNFY